MKYLPLFVLLICVTLAFAETPDEKEKRGEPGESTNGLQKVMDVVNKILGPILDLVKGLVG
ncbi:hypothetical protein Bhyg_08887, partial [Pseudolycoriella hygida]